MGITTNRDDPRLARGVNAEPGPQHEVYLVLSEEERAKGYVRPLRRAYIHVGLQPRYPLRDLTDEERDRYAEYNYVKHEAYPEGESPVVGRFWTQQQLDTKGCLTVTTMGSPIAETYARDPRFYGATYCCKCQKHLPVEEFEWVDHHGIPTGDQVGS